MEFLTIPLGGATVIVGDTTDVALYTTACVYGGPSKLDDCANVNAGFTGGAVSAEQYDLVMDSLQQLFQTSETGVFTEES